MKNWLTLLLLATLQACGGETTSDGDDGGDDDGDDGGGFGKSASAFCNYVCDCHDCDDRDRDDCEEEFSAARDIAEDLGCSDTFDDARDCILDASCSGGERLDLDPCEDVGDDLDACTDGETKVDRGDSAPLRRN